MGPLYIGIVEALDAPGGHFQAQVFLQTLNRGGQQLPPASLLQLDLVEHQGGVLAGQGHQPQLLAALGSMQPHLMPGHTGQPAFYARAIVRRFVHQNFRRYEIGPVVVQLQKTVEIFLRQLGIGYGQVKFLLTN